MPGRKRAPDARMIQVEVYMEPQFWELLDRYLKIINERLKKKSWPSVSRARLIGGILSFFFLAHHQEIQKESDCGRLTEAQRRLLSVVSHAELRELADAYGMPLP